MCWLARDHCTPSDCAAFRALTDSRQIVANMDERIYDGLIARYAPSWNAPARRGGAGAGRRPRAVDAHRQTHQCRFSHRRLDPAGQHHDAGAGFGTGAIGAARCAGVVAAASAPSPRPTTALPALAAAKKPPAPKSSRAPAHRFSLRPLRLRPRTCGRGGGAFSCQ